MEQVTIKINVPTLHSKRDATLSCTGDEVTLELPPSFKQPRFDVDDLFHAAKTVKARRDLLTVRPLTDDEELIAAGGDPRGGGAPSAARLPRRPRNGQPAVAPTASGAAPIAANALSGRCFPVDPVHSGGSADPMPRPVDLPLPLTCSVQSIVVECLRENNRTTGLDRDGAYLLARLEQVDPTERTDALLQAIKDAPD